MTGTVSFEATGRIDPSAGRGGAEITAGESEGEFNLRADDGNESKGMPRLVDSGF